MNIKDCCCSQNYFLIIYKIYYHSSILRNFRTNPPKAGVVYIPLKIQATYCFPFNLFTPHDDLSSRSM